ncbi:MAG TPA: diguanylate cyclase, partial [Nitrospirota bacterium]|nr:diguanylate cyclase [Nitrospirota bacterium]
MDKLVPTRLFSRLSIASKMLLGYMLLVVLTIIVVAYALFSLQQINRLNKSIIQTNIPAQEAADKMLEAVLAQDTYEKRFLILRSNDIIPLFSKRGAEFNNWMDSLKKLPSLDEIPIQQLETLHKQYSGLFKEEVGLIQANKIKKASSLSNGELRRTLDKLIDTLKSLSLESKQTQDHKMKQISMLGRTAFFTTAVLCILSLLAGALAGFVVTHHIASSIHKLKVATEHIAEGDFEYDPLIQTEDEIGTLSTAFTAMGKRLKKLEEMYLDASPLTRLPGGIAIENVLKKRIESKLPVAFCVVDLDNFKAFNDRYGYAHGSEVIKETAKIIEAAVKNKGNPDDFVGHVGGDDFVFITTPTIMRDVSNEILSRFDKGIPGFYSKEDRDKGYIAGKTRQGVDMKFPIMTISIAIVTNENREFTDPLEV